jgi:hypothetical protein
MAHYAVLDENNIVVQVITGRDEDEVVDGISDWEEYYSQVLGQRCVRTSYNTLAGAHIEGGEPFRGNYAGIGFTFDENLDAFIAPQPFASWSLNEGTFTWEPPVALPEDGETYSWDEEAGNWSEVTGE